jgi:hypothetical protein
MKTGLSYGEMVRFSLTQYQDMVTPKYGRRRENPRQTHEVPKCSKRIPASAPSLRKRASYSRSSQLGCDTAMPPSSFSHLAAIVIVTALRRQ